MPSNAIQEVLKQSFPKSNIDNWSEKASEELRGGNVFELFSWKTRDGLVFKPYYDALSTKSLAYENSFRLQPSAALPTGIARSWRHLSCISVGDEKNANALALNHLKRGADGLLFDISNVKWVDFNALLDGITWPYCDISFLTGASTNVWELWMHIQQKKYDAGALSSAIYWKESPKDVPDDVAGLFAATGIRPLGIYIASSTPVNEISEALLRGVSLLDRLTDAGFDKEIVLRNICLSFAIDDDFLIAVAKLKAARLLWYLMAQAFGVKSFLPEDMQIQARSEKWTHEGYQPHGNMLKGTMASLSGVLGGCNTLATEAEDEENLMMSRIAANVSHILKEEAHLDKVADPVAGAYAMEIMVDNIARSAWKAFQKNMQSS